MELACWENAILIDVNGNHWSGSIIGMEESNNSEKLIYKKRENSVTRFYEDEIERMEVTD